MTSLSIGITAHSEGIILHKTLLSVVAASTKLLEKDIVFEVIIQLDNPTPETLRYSKRIPSLFTEIPISISESSYGNPGQARNQIVKSAKGRYITFLDGDDLVSSNWFIDALELLYSQEAKDGTNKYVAHPEAVVEFEAVNNVIKRYSEIDKTTDSLLSAYANRWNVVLMIARDFLVVNPYPHGDGYGFEDWYINCLTIYNDFHNVLIPKTTLFVRRKRTASVWLAHKQNALVLPANPLLGFSYVRSLPSPLLANSPTTKGSPKNKLKPLLLRSTTLRRTAHISRKIVRKIRPMQPTQLPRWLKDEYRHQHIIEKNITPYPDSPDLYDSITPDHIQAAVGYKAIIDKLKWDSYDYIMFVPWLIKGGADSFAINYANTIAKITPEKRVLVVATVAAASPWKHKLNTSVDFLEFGKITHDSTLTIKSRLLEQLVENSQASHLHVINSEVGYNFIETHAKYIKATGKTIVATSFSESTDKEGRIFGYSHTHVPKIYDLLDAVTTDNQAVKDMWVREYGFDSQRILVHNQPITLPHLQHQMTTNPRTYKILWAARLSPEKQPAIVLKIAQQLKNQSVEIDMYGEVDKDFDIHFLKKLPNNTRYRGSFDGFSALNPAKYDTYLYTSLFDGMPNSVLEAASYGMPIIASSVGGLPEFIETGKNGILVDNIIEPKAYADAILQLIAQPESMNKFGTAIRDKIKERFSEQAYNSAIKEMLKKIRYIHDKKS